MKVTFSSYNLPPGERLAYAARKDGTTRCLGVVFRTTYGKWQMAIDNGHGRQHRHDYNTLRDAREAANAIWSNT